LPGRSSGVVGLVLLSSVGLSGATLACNPKSSGGEKHGAESASAVPSATSAAAVVAHESVTPQVLRGGVRGVIHVKGDAPPTIESIAPQIPVGKCFLAHDMYTKLFRVGEGGTLADVLVAVTEYEGDAKAPPDDVTVEAKDCAFDRRTVAMTLGQTLNVQNVGDKAQTPELVGYAGPALMLAIPHGDPVGFKPTKLGEYQLIDRTNPFVFADVFVLNYPTVAVTGLDGTFEIAGLPPGKAKVSALLPITGQTLSREVLVPSGKIVQADFEFTFDAVKDGAKARVPKPSDSK
jgi:hypothetical protein